MKLGYNVVKRIKEKAKELNNGAVRLLVFLATRADDTGLAEGIHYKEFCVRTGMCNQSFYNAKSKLIELGFIKEFKNDNRDIDILLLNNVFQTKEDYKKGYVNLNIELFQSEDFWSLTDNAMIMCLDFVKNSFAALNGSYRKNKADMYKDYEDIFKVSYGRIWSYLKALKKIFSIGVKNGIIYITPLKKIKEKAFISAASKRRSDWVQIVIRRVYAITDKKAVQELEALLSQYKPTADEQGKSIQEILFRCVKHSVDNLKRTEREVNCAYIHKLIRKELELEIA